MRSCSNMENGHNVLKRVDGPDWFSEVNQLWHGQAFSLKIKKVLHHEKSNYQDILVLERLVATASWLNLHINPLSLACNLVQLESHGTTSCVYMCVLISFLWPRKVSLEELNGGCCVGQNISAMKGGSWYFHSSGSQLIKENTIKQHPCSEDCIHWNQATSTCFCPYSEYYS